MISDSIVSFSSPPAEVTRRRLCASAAICWAALLLLPARVTAGTDRLAQTELEARILRVLPAVVGIVAEVTAEVTVHCGNGGTHRVSPGPHKETATGFIIHPDGYIATNGHIVTELYTNDIRQKQAFLKSAAEMACRRSLAREPVREQVRHLSAIRNDPRNRAGVDLKKRLLVLLPTKRVPEAGLGLPASVLFYSPPIDPDAIPRPGAKPAGPMLDVAILKIEAQNLPAVPLSSDIRRVHLGQQIAVVGYPGVVVWHTFLSPTSRAEPTITYGRISSFKTDINERRILQTDAAISWGNSGGPAFNTGGEVIGVATFLSTTLEGDQAVQGFNFLIPVDTIRQAARAIGIVPTVDSPFNREWDRALAEYARGQLQDALTHVNAAEAIVPGLIEVEDMRERLERLLAEQSGDPIEDGRN